MSTVHGGQGNIVTSGLVLNLDAANPRSYPPPYNGTVWTDLSGNTNNGTLTNGPTFNSANGGSIVFDGVNDYLNTSYNIEAATSSNLQTLCSWVYGTSTDNSFFGSGAYSTGQFHIILNFQSNGQLRFGESYYGGGQAPFDQTNIVTVSSNPTWNYACIVKTAISTYDVYFNGLKVITGATKAATLPASFNLGRWWNSRYALSNTSIVTAYNRALSASEILQNFNANRARFGV